MNLKEQLAAKKAELAALKSQIAAGDAEAIKAGEEIAEAIKNIEASIKSAEAANALLAQIGNDAPAEEPAAPANDDTVKGLYAKVKSVDKNVKGWQVTGRIKSATSVIAAPSLPEVDRIPQDVKRRKDYADYFGVRTIGSLAVTIPLLGAVEGSAAVTAQGAKKSPVSTSFTTKTLALKKITAYSKETMELVNTEQGLADAVNDVIYNEVQATANTTMITDIAGTSGIQSVTYTDNGHTGEAANLVEAILKAKKKIAEATNYEADVVFINPADAYTLQTAKDLNGQYICGGYLTGAYGTDYKSTFSLWGLPVVETSAVSAGEPLVAAGKNAVKVYRYGDYTVKLCDQNEDDALYNVMTIIGEKFESAVVTNTNGVVKITAATA